MGASAAAVARRSSVGKRLIAGELVAEGLGGTVLGDVCGGGLDDPQRVAFGVVAGVAPCSDAVPAQDAADRLRVMLPDFGDVEPELEAWAPPWHPNDLAAEDLGGETFTIGSRGDRDPGVGVQVVDVSGIDQPVHRGVDRRCRAALAVQAEIEGGDHLVLTLDAGVDVDERPQSVESQGRQTVLGERAEVAS